MPQEKQQLEITLLFEAMYQRYGYDFREYSYPSARRRVLHLLHIKQLNTIAELQHLVIHQESMADELLMTLSINVTEMFRDPLFFKLLRDTILPRLSHEPHLKVWHAGCSSGEEAYSMAILLHELKLLNNTQIYATDFNKAIIEHAKQGIIPLNKMQSHIENYQLSGGHNDFADYYLAQKDNAILSQLLKKRIMFSHHNLTEDGSFGEMNLIICRNVLIYFDKSLQARVFQLFVDSLCIGGFLCLGSHETLYFSQIEHLFEPISAKQKIYCRIA